MGVWPQGGGLEYGLHAPSVELFSIDGPTQVKHQKTIKYRPIHVMLVLTNLAAPIGR